MASVHSLPLTITTQQEPTLITQPQPDDDTRSQGSIEPEIPIAEPEPTLPPLQPMTVVLTTSTTSWADMDEPLSSDPPLPPPPPSGTT